MTESNLRLLPVDCSLDNIESRMTSVSQGTVAKSKPTASLSVVLKQALQSDDVEQLEWVVSQSDSVLVETTLKQLNDKTAITQFFHLVINKFHGEKQASLQLSVVTWLRTLLRLHWTSIVERASPEDL